MFKNKPKKEQKQQNSTAVIEPIDAPELQETQPQQLQPVLPAQEIQQPAQEQPVQVQQPVQQPTQETQPTAYIVQAVITEQGLFRYVIDANYPLILGNCILTQ